jgi:hypothetical protein
MDSNTLQNTQHICHDKVKLLETIPITECLTRYLMALHHLQRFDNISCTMKGHVKRGSKDDCKKFKDTNSCFN